MLVLPFDIPLFYISTSDAIQKPKNKHNLHWDFNKEQHNQQEYLAASLVAWLRCHFSAGNWEDVGPRLEEAIDLLPQYDSEGYGTIVLSWKARMHMHLHNDTKGAIALLQMADSASSQIESFKKFDVCSTLRLVCRR